MLVVINAASTIRKIWISHAVSMVLNNLDRHPIAPGFYVDYTTHPWKIYSENNQLVYGDDVHSLILNDEDGSLNSDGHDIVKSAGEFYNLLLNENKDNHLKDYCGDTVFYDLGWTDKEDFEVNYQDILDVYNTRPLDVDVVSGYFSKYVIEKLHAELGDNLVVVNITRNPSVSFLLDDTWSRGLGYDPVEQDFPVIKLASEYIGTNLKSGIFSNLVLKDLDYVQTVKFEDLIKSKTLNIAGKNVDITSYEPFNDYITNYEKTDMVTSDDVQKKRNDLSGFNGIFSDLHSSTNLDPLRVPKSIFDSLGYTPLDYTTIVG
jgi:hypothetical protein